MSRSGDALSFDRVSLSTGPHDLCVAGGNDLSGCHTLPGAGNALPNRVDAVSNVGIHLSADRNGVSRRAHGLSASGHDLRHAGGNNVPNRCDAMSGV
jgi:hypothetical protein